MIHGPPLELFFAGNSQMGHGTLFETCLPNQTGLGGVRVTPESLRLGPSTGGVE